MFGFGYNKEKSRASAEKYLQQNKLPNAIAEYEKILQVEPRDLAILNTVGDIYARLGQNEKAIERFRVIAESYATDGFLLKSIAMYRKITKLDPNGLPAMEKLAELYRKQGLVSDARSMLLQAAEAYTRKGQSKETLRLLKQLVLFDPENVQVITRTADLMNQGGQKAEAREMLSRTASLLVDRHALDPAQKILSRLISLDPDNLRAQELRAQVNLELGDFAKAAELYEAIPDLDSRPDGLRNLLDAYIKLDKIEEPLLICRKLVTVHHDAHGVLKVAACLYRQNDTVRTLALYSDFSSEVLALDKEEVLAHLHGSVSRVRSDPESLQSLYNLFQRAGESSMFAEVLELLAHASVQSNQLERARDAYKNLIELEPENSAHAQAYRQVCARLGTPGAPIPAPAPSTKSEDEPRTLQEFLSSEEPDLPRQHYTPQIEEKIATALTEAELCESFASKTRGIVALEGALSNAPDDLRINRALATLYRQEGSLAKAARCHRNMQRVLEVFGASAAAAYYAVLAGPEQTTTWEAKGSEFAARDFDLGSNSGIGSTEEIDLSGEWESVWANPAPSEPAVPPSFPAPVAIPPAEDLSELVEEVRFCLAQQIWPEAESGIARLAAVAPKHPELPGFRAQLPPPRASRPAAPAPQRYNPVEVIEVSDKPYLPPPPAAPLPSAPPAPTLSSLAAELDAELGDSFFPAPQPRREPPAAPPPPVAPPRYDPPVAAPAPAPRQAPPPPPQLVPYLAAAVEPVLAPPEEIIVPPPLPPSVFGDLLQDFERDLAAPMQDEDDPETHFNLGIAFREMGLLDEAIGELQKVCRIAPQALAPGRAQQAYIWLATCFVEKEVPEASFKWFIRALESAPDEDSRIAVNYELASAYEAAGRRPEALEHFMEVYGNNIDYRDVATRIRALRSAV